MKRKASEIYTSGDYTYCSIVVNNDGTYTISILSKKGTIASFKIRQTQTPGQFEIIEDEEIEE